MTIILFKICFLIALLLVSLSLIAWRFKDLPAWARKPLVLIVYPISVIPKILLALTRDAYTKSFWREITNNFKIAWNGHYGNH